MTRYLDKYAVKLRKHTTWKCGEVERAIVESLKKRKKEYFLLLLLELSAIYSRKQIAESVILLAQRGIIELVKVL